MVNVIPTIQPFTYQASTAFQERVQLANKLNEVIDALNSLGEIPDLQAQIDTINTTIGQIQEAIADTDSEISGITSQVNALIEEVNGLLKEVVNEVVVDSPGYGQVRVKLVHEDETETTSNALQIPIIQDGGITLISGTTDRSFKIQYITMDGVTHTTNDFVIPEGGGTDVTITSISILQGDTTNDIKFQVGLSDGSTIQSNSYPIPQAAITPATTSQIGGIKVGTNLSVTADGTLSVDMTTIGTAAKADSIMWTADASKVTLHADSLAGSKFTEDIPQASQGGAGTIDASAYQKLQDMPAPDTIATDTEISDLQEQIAGLKPSEWKIYTGALSELSTDNVANYDILIECRLKGPVTADKCEISDSGVINNRITNYGCTVTGTTQIGIKGCVIPDSSAAFVAQIKEKKIIITTSNENVTASFIDFDLSSSSIAKLYKISNAALNATRVTNEGPIVSGQYRIWIK